MKIAQIVAQAELEEDQEHQQRETHVFVDPTSFNDSDQVSPSQTDQFASYESDNPHNKY